MWLRKRWHILKKTSLQTPPVKTFTYNMKRFIFSLTLLSLTHLMQAQLMIGYEIKVKIHGVSDTTIMLAHHYGSMQYVIDTVPINKNGEAVFKSNDTLPGGIYLVVAPSMNNKFFEFVVSGNEKQFTLETDTADFVKNMKVYGSEENKIFYYDLNFIVDKKADMAVLNEKYKAVGENTEEGKKIKEDMKLLNKQVEEERNKIIEEHPGLFYGLFLKGVTDIKIPETPLNEDGTRDSTFAIRYVRMHYFDNVDFNDPRFLRTNLYDTRIKKYLKDYIHKIPDSLNSAIDFILEKTKVNKNTFQFVTVMLLNEYATSKVMGYDAVYVHMVDKYYTTGQAYWLDDVGLYRIQAQADRVRPTLIGNQAPPLVLQDTSNNDISLYSLKNRFTVILYWSPDCGHCKREMPKVEALYPELKKLNAEVYAVYSEEEWEKWKTWLKEHQYPWINVSNMKLKESFQLKYNVDQTPMIFILDENKKIIGKKIGVEQIKDIILHQIDIEEMDKDSRN